MSDISKKKREARRYRHKRVRRKVMGTAERPRMVVYRSLNQIYAQIIDDMAGNTLVSSSSVNLDLPEEKPSGQEKKGKKSIKMRRSEAAGKMIAEKALQQGIERVVFDRNGYSYHGRVAALADAARKEGLKF